MGWPFGDSLDLSSQLYSIRLGLLYDVQLYSLGLVVVEVFCTIVVLDVVWSTVFFESWGGILLQLHKCSFGSVYQSPIQIVTVWEFWHRCENLLA